MKNVELQSHVAKGELHNPIPAVYYSISCGQKWPPKYDGHFVFQQGFALDDRADLFSQEGLLINSQPLFDSAQVL